MNHDTQSRLYRSRYNYFTRERDSAVAYNARTGRFILLSKDDEELLQSQNPIDPRGRYDNLLKMGFLHCGDELEIIRRRYEESPVRLNPMAFTVAPTMRCNLRCSYCYQQDRKRTSTMSREVQDGTLCYIESKLGDRNGESSDEAREAHVTWYGEEPLLAKTTVLNMSARIRRTAERIGSRIHGMGLVSNCSLLDRSTARDLAEVGINRVQVSFDALVGDGISKRGVLDDTGQASLILRNILEAREFVTILIRLNVSETNIEEIPEMVQILESHGLSARYGLARVCGQLEGCSGMDCKSPRPYADERSGGVPALPVREFARLEREFQLDRADSKSHFMRRLIPRPGFCGATSLNMLVIDPEGYVSRCWESVGIASESTGHIFEVERTSQMDGADRLWKAYSPLDYADCEDCSVLPLCMGGCPHRRLFEGWSGPDCRPIRDQIRHFIQRVGGQLTVKVDNGVIPNG